MDKTLFHDISYGMFAITTNYNQQNVGCIINTFCQITSEDMIVTISLNKNNFTNTAVKESRCFAVSIISEKTNPDLIKKFGFYTSKDTDKFSDFEYETISNLPVLKENTNGYFLCNVIDVVDCGTHDIFIAKVSNCERLNNFTPMTYSYYHENVKPKPQVEGKKGYVCKICGFVYEGDKLPDDFVCPLCKHPASDFEEIK